MCLMIEAKVHVHLHGSIMVAEDLLYFEWS